MVECLELGSSGCGLWWGCIERVRDKGEDEIGFGGGKIGSCEGRTGFGD